MRHSDTPTVQFLRSLIGQRGSRYRVPTPALILDMDALDRNIALMAARAREAGVALRPHAKSHKCSFIAKRQIALGAAGVCCVKLGEAEALSTKGIDSILLTSPIANADVARRAAALHAKLREFIVVVDNPTHVALLQDAFRTNDKALDVLIDVDVGIARTGVASADAALTLAQKISDTPQLRLHGVQGYGGHLQHIAGFDKRSAATEVAMQKLSSVIDSLTAINHEPVIVTGGGTGSFASDVASGTLNELQPGSYVFMDRQYREALGSDADGGFERSLSVQAQVISVNASHIVTVDAGLKAFATDGPKPQAITPNFEECEYFFMGDEHGALKRPAHDVVIGTRIEFETPHCDPTVDRYDYYCLVSGDVLVDIVPIEARGQSQ